MGSTGAGEGESGILVGGVWVGSCEGEGATDPTGLGVVLGDGGAEGVTGLLLDFTGSGLFRRIAGMTGCLTKREGFKVGRCVGTSSGRSISTGSRRFDRGPVCGPKSWLVVKAAHSAIGSTTERNRASARGSVTPSRKILQKSAIWKSSHPLSDLLPASLRPSEGLGTLGTVLPSPLAPQGRRGAL